MSETPEIVEEVMMAMAHVPRTGPDQDVLYDEARAAIAADRAALGEAGLVIVPREPTEAMLDAARDWSLKKYGQGYNHDRTAEVWRSMVTIALSE